MKTKTLKSLVCLLLLIVLGGEVILSAFSVYAGAANNTVSSPLDDLKKDPNFNVDDYPLITVDYYNKVNSDQDKNNDIAFMEVIQIAESSGGELVIYVYQPTHYNLDLEATSISISLGFSKDGQDLSPKIYDLKLLSSEGVFDKYVVERFVVPDEFYRYYNIVALYREFNEKIDTLAGGSLVEDYEVGMSVGQQWCAYNQNDNVVYEMCTFKTIDIDINYTDSIRLKSGLTFGNLLGVYNESDLWFVAFDFKDYNVKKIFDADIVYRERIIKYAYGAGTTYGEWSDPIPVYLSEFGGYVFDGGGLFSIEYSFDQIFDAKTFLQTAKEQKLNFDGETLEAIENSDFVFVFAQTEYYSNNSPDSFYYYYSDVAKVGIIRVKFMDFSGDVYNMGAVTDLVNPDNIAGGYGDGIDYDLFTEWFEKIVALLGIVLLLVLFSFVPGLLTVIWGGISIIFKVLILILKIPLSIFKKIFNFQKK